jgi:elongation factor G
VSDETGDTIISGIGELHLDVYLERMRREYNAEVTTGMPRVAYRETITARAEFNYVHKKQTGGAGQFGRVAGYMEPVTDEDFVFENKISGGAIPTQFIAAVEKGFKKCLDKGPRMEFPVTGIRVVIDDGASHSVDSSDMAFQAAARGAFLEGYAKAKPVIQEPIMKVVVESPTEFQGAVMGSLNQRRGTIVGTQDEGPMCAIEAQVPLAEMFGYSTVLRSATQGKAQFTMEFFTYRQVPKGISEELVKKAAGGKENVA